MRYRCVAQNSKYREVNLIFDLVLRYDNNKMENRGNQSLVLLPITAEKVLLLQEPSLWWRAVPLLDVDIKTQNWVRVRGGEMRWERKVGRHVMKQNDVFESFWLFTTTQTTQ